MEQQITLSHSIGKMAHTIVQVVLFTHLLLVLNLHRSLSAVVPRIVGGYKTTIESHPYMVNLWYHGYFGCGGSLITPICVLTAAHCFDELLLEELDVYGGDTMIKQGAGRKVLMQLVPKKYNPDIHDIDVAILKLESPLWSSKVRLAELDFSPLQTGEKVTVSGWGVYDGFNRSKQLMAVNVTVKSQSYCRSVYGEATVTENMFCASEHPAKDACEGDSGGPVIRNGKQVGIISFGSECGDEIFPGVYTRLGSKSVEHFIRSIVKQFC